MSIATNIPQIQALKRAVERKSGLALATHSEFAKLATEIEQATGSHTSESTYERLWSYSTRSCDRISVHILDILCRYLGYEGWCDFLAKCPEVTPIESENIAPAEAVDASALEVGTQVKLAWLPDREMTVRCLGNCRFEVIEAVNTAIKAGDTFSAIIFQKGRELFLDKYLDGSGEEHRYAVGQKNGLTRTEIIC